LLEGIYGLAAIFFAMTPGFFDRFNLSYAGAF
jgi:hypothetical protein